MWTYPRTTVLSRGQHLTAAPWRWMCASPNFVQPAQRGVSSVSFTPARRCVRLASVAAAHRQSFPGKACFPALSCASIAATWRWEEWRAPSHFPTFSPLPFPQAPSSASAGGRAGSLPAPVVTVSHVRSLLWTPLRGGWDPYALGENTAPGHQGRLWQKQATPTQPVLHAAPSGRRQLALGFPVLASSEFKLRMNTGFCVGQSCARKGAGVFCTYFMALSGYGDGREPIRCMCTCTFSCCLHMCACICAFPYCV